MKLLKIFSELSVGKLAILAILASVGYYFMYFDDGSTLEAQIATVQGQLQAENVKRVEIEKKMKKEEEMRGNNLQLARNLDVLKSKIPNDFKESEMSALVNKASSISGVKINILSRRAGASQRPAAATGAELIEEVGFDITMSGSFHSILMFVEMLSKEEKIIKIRDFVLEKNTQNIEDNQVRLRGEIVGYKQSSIALNSKGGQQ